MDGAVANLCARHEGEARGFVVELDESLNVATTEFGTVDGISYSTGSSEVRLGKGQG